MSFKADIFSVSLVDALTFSSCVYSVGVFGLLINRRSLLALLISLEIALLGLVLGFALTSLILVNPSGQVFAALILVAAAAESVIGLSLIVLWYRTGSGISVLRISRLKG